MVVACDENRGIGIKNQLPWRLPGDLKYFRRITTGDASSVQNAVIMGRKTWESIPNKFRPLSDRINIIVTRDQRYELPQGVIRAHSLQGAVAAAKEAGASDIFVTGGAQIYREGLDFPGCRRIYITQILATFECDVFFPIYKDRFNLVSHSELHEENGTKYRWDIYEKSV
jgi:dihydrofolate reductase